MSSISLRWSVKPEPDHSVDRGGTADQPASRSRQFRLPGIVPRQDWQGA
jgi:hypothetical protein